jgi:hypothetical protein
MNAICSDAGKRGGAAIGRRTAAGAVAATTAATRLAARMAMCGGSAANWLRSVRKKHGFTAVGPFQVSGVPLLAVAGRVDEHEAFPCVDCDESATFALHQAATER